MNRTRLRGSRGLALTGAAVALVPLLAAPAGAATSSTGSATSGVTLVSVTSPLGTVQTVTASLQAAVAAARTAKIALTPLASSVTGAVGTVEVTPANSPKSIGAGTIALPGGLGSLQSPALQAVAALTAQGPVAQLTGDALGSLTVLGQQITLGSGTLDFSSTVTGSSADAGKALEIDSIALPTVADLLEGLGLDLSALDVDQLTALVDVVISTVGTAVADAIAAADAQVAALQAELGTTADTVAEATALVADATTDVSDATDAVDTATAAVTAALAPVNDELTAINAALTLAGLPTISPLTANSWTAVTPEQETVIDAVMTTAGSADAVETLDAAVTALSLANAALAAANDLLATAQDLLDQILALLDGVTDALAEDPLAVLGGVSLETLATAAKTASATGAVSVGSLEILGEDAVPAQLTALLGEVTGALADVLNGITGVTFTPPAVAVGQVTKSTSKTANGSAADVAVDALRITMPTIELPSALALDNAANLPGLDLVDGLITSSPATVTVGRVVEAARYTAASTSAVPTTPGTNEPGMPTTGGPAALALAGLLAAAGALVLRRRLATAAE